MRWVSGIYFAVTIFLASFIYVVYFGDAGALRQTELREELSRLQANIKTLEQENELLSEKYYLLRSGQARASQAPGGRYLFTPGSLILKYDSTAALDGAGKNGPHFGAYPGLEDAEAPVIDEVRVLYLVASVLIILTGYFILGFFRGPEDIFLSGQKRGRERTGLERSVRAYT